MTLTGLPSSTNLCSSNFTCVVLPLRSSPSSTIKAPLAPPAGPAELAMAAVARSLIEAILF